jgi:hypothetical protein
MNINVRMTKKIPLNEGLSLNKGIFYAASFVVDVNKGTVLRVWGGSVYLAYENYYYY